MIRLFIISCCLLFSATLVGQPETYAFRLQQGEIYFIQFSMLQQTETEQPISSGIVSLDIHGTIRMKVREVVPGEAYHFSCLYTDLEMGFFSPQSEIAISSSNKAFKSIRKYLADISNREFNLWITPYGKVLRVSGLDSIMMDLHISEGDDDETQKLLIRTIEEAFGPAAFQSVMNITMNVYDSSSTTQSVKEGTVTFNASQVKATNRFYYAPLANNTLRIQGVGVIHETTDSISHDRISIVNLTKGSQTYDMLYDLQTGWLIEGISKQKIQTLGIIRKHARLPEGLKVPSYTDAEITLKGGRYEE